LSPVYSAQKEERNEQHGRERYRIDGARSGHGSLFTVRKMRDAQRKQHYSVIRWAPSLLTVRLSGKDRKKQDLFSI